MTMWSIKNLQLKCTKTKNKRTAWEVLLGFSFYRYKYKEYGTTLDLWSQLVAACCLCASFSVTGVKRMCVPEKKKTQKK